MIQLHIEITDDELEQLQKLAEEYGFESPEAYLKSLAFEPSRAELLNDIRQGLLAIARGNPMPTFDQMWAELERM
jgi:hypothetical protein